MLVPPAHLSFNKPTPAAAGSGSHSAVAVPAEPGRDLLKDECLRP